MSNIAIEDRFTDRRTPAEMRQDRILDIVFTTVACAVAVTTVILAGIGMNTVISWIR